VKVSLSPEAQADLDEIAGWIDDDNPERADSFVDELERACASLGEWPLRFPVLPGLRLELRKRVHRGYFIFYRLDEEGVQVVRIGHGAQDWVSLLGGAE
jgi:plasmid stabilization system protein ParE